MPATRYGIIATVAGPDGAKIHSCAIETRDPRNMPTLDQLLDQLRHTPPITDAFNRSSQNTIVVRHLTRLEGE